MESNKKIAPPGYVIAAMLFMLPLLDGIVTLFPFRFGEERWRFGALGSLGNMTLFPLLGILVAMALTVMFDHRRTRQILGAVSALFAVFFAGAVVIFVLDYFQVRTQVRPEAKRVMDVAAGGSMLKQVLTIFALTLLARAGLSGPKAVKRESAAPDESSTPLIRPGGVRAG